MTDYSILKGLWKAGKNTLYMAIPFVFPILTDWFNTQEWSKLTLGGILILGMNYLKVKLESSKSVIATGIAKRM